VLLSSSSATDWSAAGHRQQVIGSRSSAAGHRQQVIDDVSTELAAILDEREPPTIKRLAAT